MGLDSVEQAAEGILAIVNENMAGALRLVSVQRGHDPRDFALVAYGGAGPLHANALAKLMGSFPVIVPPAPGLLCAIGDLVADFRDEFAQTYIRLLGDASGDRGRGHPRRRSAGSATAWLEGEGIADGRPADRLHAPTCATTGRATRSRSRSTRTRCAANGLGDLEERFNAAARAALRLPDAGHRVRDRQPARGRLRRRAEAASCRSASSARPDASAAVVDEHEVVFDGERVPTKIYDRAKLEPGATLEGPAIVTEFDSTTVVLPGYRGRGRRRTSTS